MKWIKHMTATTNDEKIARLIGDGGVEGLARYGMYWRVLEVIAAQMEGKASDSCSVSLPVSVWSRLLFTRGSLVFSALSRLAVTGLVTVERDGDDIRVTNRNLWKFKDEYARKSGHTPDNVPPHTDTESDTELDTDMKKATLSSPQSVPPEELAGTLPLLDGTEYSISKAQIAEWSQAFPAVRVKDELRRFKVWLDANPSNRKTPRGIKRAIVRWLSRAQDKPLSMNGAPHARVNQNFQALQESIAERHARGGADDGGDDAGSEVGQGNPFALFRAAATRIV